MSPGKPSALVKPTKNTKFHIDYEWWEHSSSEDLRTYMLSHLPPERRERLSQSDEDRVVDFINPETGEISQLDELGLAIQLTAKEPDFIGPTVSLVDCIFRIFLANGNVPQTPQELAGTTGRPASIILKTLRGIRVYKGIRPYQPT